MVPTVLLDILRRKNSTHFVLPLPTGSKGLHPNTHTYTHSHILFLGDIACRTLDSKNSIYTYVYILCVIYINQFISLPLFHAPTLTPSRHPFFFCRSYLCFILFITKTQTVPSTFLTVLSCPYGFFFYIFSVTELSKPNSNCINV